MRGSRVFVDPGHGVLEARQNVDCTTEVVVLNLRHGDVSVVSQRGDSGIVCYLMFAGLQGGSMVDRNG